MTGSDFSRWYDRDKRINLLIEVLRYANDTLKNDIAYDIIQLINQICPQKSDIIVNSINNNSRRGRWYDKFDTLRSAIEMMRYLSSKEKEFVLSEIFAFNNI